MKKKILFCIYSLETGGTEKVLIDILNQLDRKKFDINILIMRKGGRYVSQVPKDINIKYIFLGDEMIEKYPKLVKNIYKIIRKFGTLLILKFPVLINLFKGNYFDTEIAFEHGLSSVLMSKNLNKKSKKIFWVHTDLERSLEYKARSVINKKLVNKINLRKIYKKADQIICVSENAKNVLSNYIEDIDKEKLKVIHNPIDSEKIINMSKESIEYKRDYITIVACGRLVEEKKFNKLIKVHKRLIEFGINNKLIIVGDGPKRPELEGLCMELNVEKSVYITGFTSNPYKYIGKADIFVSCSDYEGYSLVIGEAIVLNKLIVSTDTEGPREILKDGLLGILTDFNEDSIFNGVYTAITDKDKVDFIKNNIKKYKLNNSCNPLEDIEQVLYK